MQLWEAGEPYVAEPKVKVTKAVPAAVKVGAASSSKTKKSKPKKIGKGRPRAVAGNRVVERKVFSFFNFKS